MVAVIDGLDEYDPPATSAGDPLAAFLPHALPAGVSVLCASRPRHPYVASLAARDGEFVQIDRDDAASAADNEATVRAFWDREAGPLGFDPRVCDDVRFLDEAVARAAGNLQHAIQLRKQLAALSAEQRHAARHPIEGIPRGLAALIARFWEAGRAWARPLPLLASVPLDEMGRRLIRRAASVDRPPHRSLDASPPPTRIGVKGASRR